MTYTLGHLGVLDPFLGNYEINTRSLKSYVSLKKKFSIFRLFKFRSIPYTKCQFVNPVGTKKNGSEHPQ